jgi:dTDP-glucose pyrophosphorylase
MTMAGEGSRFKDAGYDIPKPLIDFNGKPLFAKSLETLNGVKFDTLTCVVRKEHVDKYHIDKEIQKYYPNALIVAVENTTRGAAETAFIAIRALILSDLADFTDSLVIMDCDVAVESIEWKPIIMNPKFDGVLLSFDSNDPRYSYADVVKGKVTRTAEKDPISNHALTSPYFIKKIEDFVDSFHEMEEYKDKEGNPTYKELYVSILYNFMIANGKKVIIVKADKITSLGTPEELEKAKREL